VPLAQGVTCTDSNACTVGDTCDASQNCVPGAPLTCNTPPANSCTDSNTLLSFSPAGTCSAAKGCSYTSTSKNCPFGCSNSACNPDPCTSVSCTTVPNDCYTAGSGTCVGGICQFTPLAANTPCVKDLCDVGDKCDGSGKCVAGTPKPIDDSNPCTADVCDGTGKITHTNVSDGTNCDDGDLCNGIDLCQAGVCKKGAPNPCSTPPIGGCYAATGTCNQSDGSCTYQPSSPTTTCNDTFACTTGDKCDGNGHCGGAAVICTPGAPTCFDVNTSRTFTAGTCDAASGACSIVPSDKHCDFGCDSVSGLCKQDPCIGIVCNAPTKSCEQQIGACVGGTCVYPVTPDAACDDGDPCTSNDKCSNAGDCAGTPIACNTPDPPKCSDANTSTTENSSGTCSNAMCKYTTTPTTCTKGCDATSGLCVGDPCKGITCDQPPDQCHQDHGTCGADGMCKYDLKVEGATCDDGKPCTTNDKCDASGTCAGETSCNAPPATTCDAAKPISHGFDAAGSCNTTGACTYVGIDKTCTAGCDSTSGACNGDPCAGKICNTPSGPCYNAVGTCSSGTCAYAPRDNTASCDDGDATTTNDACDGKGNCVGTPIGTDGGTGPDAGEGTGGKTGSGGASSGGSTASSGGSSGTGGAVHRPDAGAGAPNGFDAGVVDSGTPTISGGGSGSCGCSVPRSSTSTAWPLGLLALSMLAIRRRRR
jgi:MYXO-CTERM domain-containing protein